VILARSAMMCFWNCVSNVVQISHVIAEKDPHLFCSLLRPIRKFHLTLKNHVSNCTFVPGSEKATERTFAPVELLFRGTFAPGTFAPVELSYLGSERSKNFCSVEYSFSWNDSFIGMFQELSFL